MAISRRDPFRDMLTLREAMNRLFEESFVRPGGGPGPTGPTSFPIDVAERDDQFEVRAELPGIKPEDIQVSIQGSMLTIRGESKAEEERKGDNWLVRERRVGTFQRSVTLPTAVNADRSEARYENGMLILTLPKAEEVKPKRIAIGGQQEPGG